VHAVSRIGLVLDMTARNLERVIYYEDYLVIDPGNTPLKENQLLSEMEFREAQDNLRATPSSPRWAPKPCASLMKRRPDEASTSCRSEMTETKSKQIRKKLAKRIKLLQGFHSSKSRPEWMILTVLPVIPPDLRPLVPLEGGRFATSD
jgi:DNA-directed RNA polymerase subunit beta'